MRFANSLHLEHIRGAMEWRVTSAFIVDVYPDKTIIVDDGFETDLSSVPRGLWNISPPSEYPEAAVPHDYIYTKLTHQFTKKQADQFFREALKLLGVGWIKRNLMWLGVRIGGRGNW